ncbi:alanine--tRNA ligase [Thermodesulfobacteriota bacterium]
MMTSEEIRNRFLEYFEKHDHHRIRSSSLVPAGDPTVLLTTAGMQQFKPYFMGIEAPPHRRLTSAQKCFRTSDIDEVGDENHCTFFEMLGNFSVGDYFKKEAIRFGIECLAGEFGFDLDHLWITIFGGEGEIPRDDEAEGLWIEAGIPRERIHAFGRKDNFWGPPGTTGPCGPCSELHYELTRSPCSLGDKCVPNCECGRFLEVWNLVFMQYELTGEGRYEPLPAKNIDTGAGLERIAMILQKKSSIFETDLFRPIVEAIANMGGFEPRSDKDWRSLRIATDHIRGATFLISDGVLPSNEGRGYVLRRIIRRATVHGRRLGFDRPFLYEISRAIVELLSGAYPELKSNAPTVEQVLRSEEERFGETLEHGLGIFEVEVDRVVADGGKVFPGDAAFRLYDTFGFPLELTEDLLKERGIAPDRDGFERAMEEQRTRARMAWKGSKEDGMAEIEISPDTETRLRDASFNGYHDDETESRVTALFVGGVEVDEAGPGSHVGFVTAETPFYAESGGQVGDAGVIEGEGVAVEVDDTQKIRGKWHLHLGRVTDGVLRTGTKVILKVDGERRAGIKANHTATHLLQSALREVLGSHVKQSGSLVASDRLRFDFTHFSPLTREDLDRVEAIVNRCIRGNSDVDVSVKDYRGALGDGAIALFGEKYEDKVRVVRLADYSMELCGGTHASRAGDIGLFKITAETGVAAGVRRIEALTGAHAVEFVHAEEQELRGISKALQARPGELVGRVSGLQERCKELEQELTRTRRDKDREGVDAILASAREVEGVKVVGALAGSGEAVGMRELADLLRDKLDSGIVLLGGEADGKATLILSVTKDLTDRFDAGAMIQEVAKRIGGGGGGRKDMAQAGCPDASKLPEAIEALDEVVRKASK